ncbi:MAG: OmpA family protein [Litoreibacter sp.]|nr:OmpA family protein [Litoreibacter sp.]
MKIQIVIGAVAALSLSACVQNQYAGSNSNAQTGAVIGGIAGGLLGASSSDNKLIKGVVGGAIGAAVGGAIGQQLDRQAEDLRRDIDNEDVGIVNTGSELRVTMPQDLLFDVDSTALRPVLRSDLIALAGNLNDYPDTTVMVIGHTDSTGSDDYNYDLSDRRAAVVSYELRTNGVAPGRIESFGRGESQPVASNESEYGRSQNRRVEIIIRPNAV